MRLRGLSLERRDGCEGWEVGGVGCGVVLRVVRGWFGARTGHFESEEVVIEGGMGVGEVFVLCIGHSGEGESFFAGMGCGGRAVGSAQNQPMIEVVVDGRT